MSISLQTNTSAMNATSVISVIKKQQEEAAKKLASGKRINSAGDDASGLSISEKLKAQIAATQYASSNSQDGISLIQVADGAMSDIGSMLNRVSELTVQAGNSIRSQGVGGEAIQAEINALTSEIDRVSQSTNFNGINLLNGDLSSSSGEALSLQIGASAGETLSLDINSMSASSLGLSNIDVLSNPAAALEQVTAAINSVSSSRADLGASQNRLEYNVSNLNATTQSLTDANSQIEDADIAKEIIEFSLKKAQEKAAQTKLAHATQNPSSILKLL